MKDNLNGKVPKWPFFMAGVALMAFGFFLVWRASPLVSHWEWLAVACASLGSVFGILPFLLDYRATGKLMQINALGAITDKIQDLAKFTDQITSATGRWAAVQESVGDNAEKTALAAKQISDKMTAEVREFSEFVKKMSDNEKAALRLEVDKLRRSEVEWLQMLVRILDHVFALHCAAARSNQPKVAEQIAQFQNACHGAVRRIGLVSFVGQPDEPFNPERHQLADEKQKPFDGAVIAETVGVGYTFQSRLLRPALVRLRDASTADAKVSEPAQDDLALEED